MKRLIGIFTLLVLVYLATYVMSDLLTGRHSFLKAFNQENLLRRTGLFGIIGIGVAFVIITGGIDLSVGSVVCLVGVGFPWLLVELGQPIWLALGIVFGASLLIGWFHGLLVTKMNLQPFIVTLCGLLIYRGITRGFTGDRTAGFNGGFENLRWLANGEIPITANFGLPIPFLILVIVTTVAATFLNRTIYGRYLLALGNNEDAARFSGINTDRMKILAYVVCSFLGGLGGLLFVLDTESAQPADYGNFYELYAIAAAVLGGCSLRGGSGTIIGVVIGTALIQVLRNMITLVDEIPQNIEFAVIGAVILIGAIGDELAKLVITARRNQTGA
ncbi:ABC transporter permease [Verrucomicrobiales bacterium]|jgi:ribose transport system permease protein|nr:ABC transporter permease [Verrucomicrobiales bacterium]